VKNETTELVAFWIDYSSCFVIGYSGLVYYSKELSTQSFAGRVSMAVFIAGLCGLIASKVIAKNKKGPKDEQ